MHILYNYIYFICIYCIFTYIICICYMFTYLHVGNFSDMNMRASLSVNTELLSFVKWRSLA